MCKLCDKAVRVKAAHAIGSVVDMRTLERERAMFPKADVDVRTCEGAVGFVLLASTGTHPEEGLTAVQAAITPAQAREVARALEAKAIEAEQHAKKDGGFGGRQNNYLN